MSLDIALDFFVCSSVNLIIKENSPNERITKWSIEVGNGAFASSCDAVSQLTQI